MCITAHPDDESGAFGGALLMANAAGVETTVICLTEGQAASNRGEASSGEELARMRRAEFDAAGQVLGTSRGEVLHYPDGRLAEQNFLELVGILVERIRRWRPQVILTFGPEGGVNLHRDHTTVSLATSAAFHWAGRTSTHPEQFEQGLKPYWPQKLYYSATPFLLTRNEEEMARSAMTPRSLQLELGNYAENKFEAFRQHATQTVLLEKAREIWHDTMNYEYYLLAGVHGFHWVGDDKSLFQGVVED
jgi:LmbE family N-acetylglucosaminyl deacetylase